MSRRHKRPIDDHLQHALSTKEITEYLEANRASELWLCRDGAVLRIRDMSDGHLENAIKRLQSQGRIGQLMDNLILEKFYRMASAQKQQ